MINTKYCIKCGNELHITDNYCNLCGNKVEKSTHVKIYKNYNQMTYLEKKSIILEMKQNYSYDDNIFNKIQNIVMYIVIPLTVVQFLIPINEAINDLIWIIIIILLLISTIIGYIDEKIQIEKYLKSKKEKCDENR